MAKKSSKKKSAQPGARPVRWLLKWSFRAVLLGVVLMALWIGAYAVLPVPSTPYIQSEVRRLGGVDYEWVPVDDVAPVMLRSVVAAEDANYCTHWGFDVDAIREAIDDGGQRGASTITQQTVKNAFLWHGRSWPRKALEALLTPAVEAAWSKRRILEVYLNIAEFDEGIFGIEAAARNYFRVGPEELSADQAALLAAVLPSPKSRNAAQPGRFTRNRAAQIRSGAQTIAADGRAACFED